MSRLWNNYRYLILRRFVQIGMLVLFFGANAWGWKILEGNLSSSLLFGIIPMSDPYATVQMIAAGAVVATDLLIGVAVVTLFYFFIGGRAFCSWVCPVNMVTDSADYLRRVFDIDRAQKMKQPIKRNARYWILGLSLIVSAFMGIAAFEFVSPISMMHRGLVFGMGFGWAAVAMIFLFDLLVLKNGWCGHVCPLGGFYSLLGKFSFIRVHHLEENCTLCMKCKVVCPEKQVLHMIGKESLPVLSGECTNCARCIEVCDDDALRFSIRDFIQNKKMGE
ncbi:quinol dehydrogenase ferredoxin subunit NapH [Sulfurimonas sp. SWIR-19]|uniref:quinol dehydrogenase ferredoxin subunit NapH n=1 Tax=Sulfurimonas sp. SWIR-19 TaxID=2878390 RepID=UPI001CF31939|nr:quinol dehydrogenase ferredoxin subunit NapH [Sulfurimonas sp. SWIR-19]UCN01436.1 quinol dehydrogenase ferredoxin subunit NapH [Sulfurimonas sp. SWIR-19]